MTKSSFCMPCCTAQNQAHCPSLVHLQVRWLAVLPVKPVEDRAPGRPAGGWQSGQLKSMLQLLLEVTGNGCQLLPVHRGPHPISSYVQGSPVMFRIRRSGNVTLILPHYHLPVFRSWGRKGSPVSYPRWHADPDRKQLRSSWEVWRA